MHVTYCILFCSLHCHEDRNTELGRECQARSVRPLACVVLWTAVQYQSTLLVRTVTDRPRLFPKWEDLS
jgi:hypothetical protein